MEYQLHPFERLVHTRANQAMRVRDQTDNPPGVWHNPFYILGVQCRGYDSRFDWR